MIPPTKIYRLVQAELPWGDYGDILAHGMASPTSAGDALELERTGPFIPPISIPSWDYVVVTASLLAKLQESGLTGFDVCPVIKKKVTKVDWRAWEPYGSEEMKYPAGNEPENYIVRRKHSPEAASALGELWYLRFQSGIRLGPNRYLNGPTWTGQDFFVVEGERGTPNLVSEAAKDWLIKVVPEWVEFDEQVVQWNAG